MNPPQPFPFIFSAIKKEWWWEPGGGAASIKNVFFCIGNNSKTIKERKIKFNIVFVGSLIFNITNFL